MTASKRKGAERTIHVLLPLPRSLHHEAREMAAAREQSLIGYIRDAVRTDLCVRCAKCGRRSKE